jgi:hypothetical protein
MMSMVLSASLIALSSLSDDIIAIDSLSFSNIEGLEQAQADEIQIYFAQHRESHHL